jgi:uncharacterized membrane protein YfcA
VFLAGFIDSIAGGGGLISLPIYFIAGLPSHVALANNKMSSVWGTSLSTFRYLKKGMVDVKIASISAVFALIGSYLGSEFVLKIDPFFINYILIILLPIITIFTLINKNFGQDNKSHNYTIFFKIFISCIIGLILGFYDGFFGPGTGSFLILGFTFFLGYDFKIANGNSKIINLASNIAAVTTFIVHKKVIFALGIPAAMVGICGHHLGSKYVIRKGNKFIRPVFITVLILLFLKIIYDVFKSLYL